MNLFSFWNSDKMVLRMYGAQEVDAQSAPEYYGHRARAGAARRAADAARLRHGQPAAERLRHRAQPVARRRVRLHRPAADAEPRRGRRRHGARAGAHQEPRHADHDDRRHHRRRHLDAGAVPAVRHDVRRQPRRPRRRLGHDRLARWRSSSRRSRPCWCRWRSAARANIGADRMGAQICGNPMWLASALAKIQNYAHRIPNEDGRGRSRRPRTCSSSIR